MSLPFKILGIKIPLDKLLHIIVGFFICLLTYAITKGNIISSLSASLAVGIGKELYDILKNKTSRVFDLIDIITTLTGGFISIGLIIIMKMFN